MNHEFDDIILEELGKMDDKYKDTIILTLLQKITEFDLEEMISIIKEFQEGIKVLKQMEQQVALLGGKEGFDDFFKMLKEEMDGHNETLQGLAKR